MELDLLDARIGGLCGKRYANCSIENFQCPTSGHEEVRLKVREYADDLRQRVQSGQNVIFLGPPGTGKDHLMVGLIRSALSQYPHMRLKWVNGLELFGQARDGMDSGASEVELLRSFETPHVVAISDPLPPGGELTPWRADLLFRLIDRRYRALKPIWVSMNVTTREEAIKRLGGPLVDRLRDGALVLFCNWPTWRQPA